MKASKFIQNFIIIGLYCKNGRCRQRYHNHRRHYLNHHYLFFKENMFSLTNAKATTCTYTRCSRKKVNLGVFLYLIQNLADSDKIWYVVV